MKTEVFAKMAYVLVHTGTQDPLVQNVSHVLCRCHSSHSLYVMPPCCSKTSLFSLRYGTGFVLGIGLVLGPFELPTSY